MPNPGTILQCPACGVTFVDDNDPGPGKPNAWLQAHAKVCIGQGAPVHEEAVFTAVPKKKPKKSVTEKVAQQVGKAAAKATEKVVEDAVKNVIKNVFGPRGRR